jgi:hypothetical protein
MINRLKNIAILLLMTGLLFACSKEKEDIIKDDPEIEVPEEEDEEEEEDYMEDLQLDWSCFSHLEKDKLYIFRSYDELVEVLGDDAPPEEDLEVCFHCECILMVRGQSANEIENIIKSLTPINDNQYEFSIVIKRTDTPTLTDWRVAVSVPAIDEEDEVRLNVVYE